MRQLSLWTDPIPLSSTSVVVEQRPSQAPHHETNKAADKCRAAADALQKHIDLKHASANNMLALPPTRKRLTTATESRNAAIRLERIQATLLRLAEMHESRTINPELVKITSRSAVEDALFTGPGDSPLHILYNGVERTERKEERIKRLVNEAGGRGIPSYFPTPPLLADQLVSMARIQPGNRILEPSAGTGNLIDAILRSTQDIQVAYCELNCLLLDILREKYEGVDNVRFVGRDICDLDDNRVERFDRILMNPPFEIGEDAQHILHARRALLKPGGILVSIISGGIISRTDRKGNAFRQFLRDENAEVLDLPVGSFKSSGTTVSAKIVQLEARG